MTSQSSIGTWRLSTVLILAAFVAFGSACSSTQVSAKEMMKEMSTDPAKILKAGGVYGVFATYKVRSDYGMVNMADRGKAAAEVEALVKKHSKSVLVQAYLTRGFESQSDFLLRLHAYEPANAQAFLVDFKATTIGRHSDVTETLVGVTKGLNHTTKEKSPELLKLLKGTPYSGGEPKYAFMIAIKKDAAWWNLSEKDKLALMEEHTVPTLPFLVNVKRKLYHSTGIDDTDFITYFETNDLVAFNNLNIELHSVKEMLHNTRYGRPIVMGTIHSVKDVISAVSK